MSTKKKAAKKATARRPAAKKAAKKTTARKASTKKAPARKAVAKKTAKKAPARSAASRKVAKKTAKKAPARKAAARKVAKQTVRKAPARKAAAKKAAKRPASNRGGAPVRTPAGPTRVTTAPPDWRAATLARVRALIREADPQATETPKWGGTPTWEHDGLITTGETYRQVVKLTFAHGAALPDPKRLFNASLAGGTRRAIDLREGESIDADAFKALVRAAVAHNAARVAAAKAKRSAGRKTRAADESEE